MIGLIAPPSIIMVGGAVIGGIGRAAPCGYAPDFASGALFGAVACVIMLGLPAGAIGALVGAIAGWNIGRSPKLSLNVDELMDNEVPAKPPRK